MTFTRLTAPAVALLLGLLPAATPWAEGGRMPANVPKLYIQECASCHTAYPPGMLPAASWKRIAGTLQHHYGTDASLDAASLAQLGQWLQANAATRGRVAQEPREDRITLSAWFQREHRKLDPSVWRLASVKSASNCAACHSGVDRGRFSERELAAPAGLDPLQLRTWRD